jgi:hypothetical protein
MGANRGAIDAVVPTVCHDLGQRNGHRLPDPSFTPAPEPPVDRVPVAILGRHIAPRCAAAQPQEYPIDVGSVLLRQATAAPVHCFNRKQALQNMPFCLGEIAPAQACLQKAALNQAGSRSSTNLSTSPSMHGIVTAIVEERQPATLTAHSLIAIKLPLGWVDQRALLGLN